MLCVPFENDANVTGLKIKRIDLKQKQIFLSLFIDLRQAFLYFCKHNPIIRYQKTLWTY